MANNKDSKKQELEALLKQLREDLNRTLAETMVKIAHTCAAVSPEVFAQVVESVFRPVEMAALQSVAVAAPAQATDTPSPKSAAKITDTPKRTGRRAVWANSSDRALRRAYGARIRAGRSIEPDLEAELVRRFKSYDAKSHKFIGRSRKTEWANSSDNSLRIAHSSRTRAGKALEPELEAELIRRFPTYDAATHKFLGYAHNKKADFASTDKITNPAAATAPVANTDNEILALTRLSSSLNKAGNHLLRFAGGPMLLRGAAMPYELVLFDKKTKIAVVRKKAKDLKHKFFIVKCKKGKVVEQMKMGARDIQYRPATHQLLAREAIDAISRYIVFNPDGNAEICNIVSSTEQIFIRARQTIKETIVIDEGGNVAKYELMSLAEPHKAPVRITDNTDMQLSAPVKEVVKPAPKSQTVSRPATPVAKPVSVPDIDATEQEVMDALRSIERGEHGTKQKPQSVSKPVQQSGELQVSVKLNRMSLDGAYSDVIVNGKRILHDHVDTKLELFLDGTVLGVHGVVTDNPDLPVKPMWQVYNTELRPRTFNQRHMFTKKLVYIERIKPLGEDKLVLEVSNKMRIILEKRNTGAVFKIIENTK